MDSGPVEFFGSVKTERVPSNADIWTIELFEIRLWKLMDKKQFYEKFKIN